MPPRHRQETGNNSKYERLKQLRLIIEPQNTRHGALTLFTRIFQNPGDYTEEMETFSPVQSLV